MAGEISRAEIGDRLTAALGRASAATDSDRQRAEIVAGELDELGVLVPRSRAQDMAGVFRHPVVAGITLAVVSGILASLVIPSLTRVWQDRPRELELKRSLVEEVSQSVTNTLVSTRVRARDLGKGWNPDRHRVYNETTQTWLLSSANIGAQLTTYFPDSVTTWRTYERIVHDYLVYAFNAAAGPAGKRIAAAQRKKVATHLRVVSFLDPNAEQEKHTWLAGQPADPFVDVNEISKLLLFERDQLTSEIVDSGASGFSHGFWILT